MTNRKELDMLNSPAGAFRNCFCMGQGSGQAPEAKVAEYLFNQKTEKSPEIIRFQDFYGCGRRTWTSDLRVMSPTSYQLLYSAIFGGFPHCPYRIPQDQANVKKKVSTKGDFLWLSQQGAKCQISIIFEGQSHQKIEPGRWILTNVGRHGENRSGQQRAKMNQNDW